MVLYDSGWKEAFVQKASVFSNCRLPEPSGGNVGKFKVRREKYIRRLQRDIFISP